MNRPYQPAKAWSITMLLFLFGIVNYLDKVSVSLLATPMMDEFGLTPAQFGLIGSSFFWLFAISGVVGGFVSNRIATTGLLLTMAIAWSLCQLPMAMSSSFTVFVIARVLLGAAEGPAAPLAVHACYKWFPDSRRNLPVAVFAQGATVGLMLAGILIPFVTAHWGWRANFYVLSGLGAIWAILWLALGKEGPLDHAVSADSDRGKVPYGRLLTDRTVLGCLLLRFVAYWALALSLTWFAAYLQRGLGYDHATSGRLFAVIVAISAPTMIGAAWLSQRMLACGISSRVARGRLAALMLVAAGVSFGALLVPGLPNAWRVAVLALGHGLVPAVYVLGPAMLAEVTPAAQRGAVLAIDASVSSLAGIVAPLVMGYLIQSMSGSRGYELGFALCGVLMVTGGLAGALLVNPEKSKHAIAAFGVPDESAGGISPTVAG